MCKNKHRNGGNISKIIVAYWSQTGNTEAMANAVGEGIKAAGGEADVVPVSAVSVDELKAASSFALGCPAMGAEVLEESEMEPFVEEVEGFAAGKSSTGTGLDRIFQGIGAR